MSHINHCVPPRYIPQEFVYNPAKAKRKALITTHAETATSIFIVGPADFKHPKPAAASSGTLTSSPV